MTVKSSFKGFPRECVQFYSELARNNNRTWFSEHKADFDKYVLEPAQDFVFEMGKLLQKISPKVIADPRLDKSIFRPYRDTRFQQRQVPVQNPSRDIFLGRESTQNGVPRLLFSPRTADPVPCSGHALLS